MQDNTYRSTGTFSPAGVGIGLALAVIAMFPIAFLYSYAVRYIPFIYINFLISFGAVFAVAYIYTFGESLGRNRSRVASLAAMLLAGVLTLFVFWVTFLYVLSERRLEYVKMLTDPAYVIDLIKELINVGWFTLKRNRVKGTFYGIMLAVEAVVYIGIFVFVWWTALKSRVFCEKCQKWVVRESVAMFFDLAPLEAIATSLATGTDAWVDALFLAQSTPSLRVELASCAHCNELHVLTLVHSQDVVDKDGNPSTEEKNLLENVLISTATAARFQARVAQLQADFAAGN
ncbi:hypothetical protein KJ975_06350 [Myxococcota bacterium]|nr:hypothetical protein [Myxococcota bacterium]